MTSLTYTSNESHPLGNVFETMMEKGQDQIPEEGFLMAKDKNVYVFYNWLGLGSAKVEVLLSTIGFYLQ
jgi:hypothetical protein